MKSLGILHTTVVTVNLLRQLAKELMPEVQVINILDDSILPYLLHHGGEISGVEERMTAYARFAEQAGASIIVLACSSIGELAEKLQTVVSVPVLRIDAPMAEEAVRRGTRIGIVATVPTTLHPTTRLVQREAQKSGRQSVEIYPVLVENAFQKLSEGDRTAHDVMVAQAIESISHKTDVIVLAQVSMSEAVSRLPFDLQEKCLTSPKLGMERVRDVSHTIL